MKAYIFIILYISSMVVAWAGLPEVSKHEDWSGCFTVHEGSRYDFCMSARGEMWLIPMQRDRDPVAELNRIRIHYGIEEVMPDGRSVLKEVYVGTLASEQPAGLNLSRVVVTGECTGGARFEMVIEESRDVVSLGGRVLDPGRLTQNPLRFTYRLMVPNVYRSVEMEGRKDQRAFEKRSRGDYLELLRWDRSRVRLRADAEGEALDGEALTREGIERLELQLSYYEGRRFHFAATASSRLSLSNGGHPRYWHQGFVAHWWPDPERDKDGKARLMLCVK